MLTSASAASAVEKSTTPEWAREHGHLAAAVPPRFRIASALRVRSGASWRLRPSYVWAYDQRMIDPRCPMTPLAERLPELLASFLD